jgi:hypothetical protein
MLFYFAGCGLKTECAYLFLIEYLGLFIIENLLLYCVQ